MSPPISLFGNQSRSLPMKRQDSEIAGVITCFKLDKLTLRMSKLKNRSSLTMDMSLPA